MYNYLNQKNTSTILKKKSILSWPLSRMDHIVEYFILCLQRNIFKADEGI